VPVNDSRGLSGPKESLVSGPVAEVVVQGEGLEAYVSSDDEYLDLKVLVLDAWRQAVAGDNSAVFVTDTLKKSCSLCAGPCVHGCFACL
jgi:hypothetical protein